MTQIRFLHLSDLHINDSHLRDTEVVLNALWRDLERYRGQIDYLLFNGDLIQNGSRGEVIEFELALDRFIEPLLHITGLSADNLFIVPGNHDVDRRRIQEFHDRRLADKFQDSGSLNRFLDDLPNHASLLQRLDGFHSFVRLLKNEEYTSEKQLFSAYSINHKDALRIGIACLNSAWCAEGDDDYKNILIGERQVDAALERLEGCDLKIALIHHPLDWLKEFDRASIFERLLTGFNLVCTGHVHREQLTQTISQQARTVFLQANALFDGRDKNGYSVITYDILTQVIKVEFREYFDRRREFDTGLSIVRSGEAQFDLSRSENFTRVRNNLLVKQDLRLRTGEAFSKRLITYSKDTFAPKQFEEIYISPYVSKKPESFTREEAVRDVTNDLDKVLSEERHLMFIGRKEIGKTTLLNNIYKIIENSNDPIVPFVMDFRTLTPSRSMVQKGMDNFLRECDCYGFDIVDNLDLGNCVLLIDNVDVRDVARVRLLKQFCETYPKNRFIFTANEDLLQTLKLVESPDLGCDYATYYLYTFRRNQIRSLTRKWFSQNQDINVDVVLDRVMLTLRRIGVPRTPFTVSLLLWILEKQTDFVPLNEATLIERFVEILLEKLTISDLRYDAVDYTIKIDFLAGIAHSMVTRNRFVMTQNELDQKILDYFSHVGLEINVARFKEFFFEKGIFALNGGYIEFRYQCFFEFFVAKYMEDNQEFSTWALAEERYLNFANEIVYLTGLNRKRLDLLKLIESRLLSSFADIDPLVDLEQLSTMQTLDVLPKLIRGDNAREEIAAMAMTDDEKDVALDDGTSLAAPSSDDKERAFRLEEQYFGNLELYAKIIRNSELISKDDKRASVRICIEKYAKITGLLYQIVYDFVRQTVDLKEASLEAKGEWQYILTVGVPLVMQAVTLLNLGTPKLKLILQEEFDESQTDFERLTIASLYGDLRLEGYIDLFARFIEMTDSKVLREIALIKLWTYNAFHTLSREEHRVLINLIADLHEAQRHSSPRERDTVIRDLNRMALRQKASRVAE